MTTINNSSLAAYLNQRDTGSAGQLQQAGAPSMATALAGVNGTQADNNGGSSYLLDLSDEAKTFMQTSFLNGGTTPTSNMSDIVLNQHQQSKLNAILAKYQDAPFNDVTFQKIQKEMATAGLDPEALAAQTQMRALNPTLMLLNALGGGDGSAGTVGTSVDIKTAAHNFLGSVIDQWKQISTTLDDAADSTAGGNAA